MLLSSWNFAAAFYFQLLIIDFQKISVLISVLPSNNERCIYLLYSLLSLFYFCIDFNCAWPDFRLWEDRPRLHLQCPWCLCNRENHPAGLQDVFIVAFLQIIVWRHGIKFSSHSDIVCIILHKTMIVRSLWMRILSHKLGQFFKQ
jgi:hypothetical protein